MSVFSWYNYDGDIVRKYILLFLMLFLLCACDDVNHNGVSDEVKAISKLDIEKDTIYFIDGNSYQFSDGSSFLQKIPIINFDTEDVNSVNLELKSRILVNNRKAMLIDGYVNKVLFDEFEVVENDRSISLIVKEYCYMNGDKSITDLMVYVFNKKNMKLYSNDSLLQNYNLSFDDLYDRLSFLLEDDLYYLMMIKNSDFKLYIDENENLVLLSIINGDDDSELKKVIITE